MTNNQDNSKRLCIQMGRDKGVGNNSQNNGKTTFHKRKGRRKEKNKRQHSLHVFNINRNGRLPLSGSFKRAVSDTTLQQRINKGSTLVCVKVSASQKSEGSILPRCCVSKRYVRAMRRSQTTHRFFLPPLSSLSSTF